MQMYIHICTYTHIHVYTYVYVCMWKEKVKETMYITLVLGDQIINVFPAT